MRAHVSWQVIHSSLSVWINPCNIATLLGEVLIMLINLICLFSYMFNKKIRSTDNIVLLENLSGNISFTQLNSSLQPIFLYNGWIFCQFIAKFKYSYKINPKSINDNNGDVFAHNGPWFEYCSFEARCQIG